MIMSNNFPDMIIVNTELQPLKEGVTIDQKKQKLSIYLFLLSAIVWVLWQREENTFPIGILNSQDYYRLNIFYHIGIKHQLLFILTIFLFLNCQMWLIYCIFADLCPSAVEYFKNLFITMILIYVWWWWIVF